MKHTTQFSQPLIVFQKTFTPSAAKKFKHLIPLDQINSHKVSNTQREDERDLANS